VHGLNNKNYHYVHSTTLYILITPEDTDGLIVQR